ncbi:MAG: CotH kinase family protein [Ruminococcus sp.]|nr:CotH kinase family protein [Ruminococcus sp.]
MKRTVSLLLCLCLILSLFTVIPASASAETIYSVPRITITTENGNGTALEKADGYVNAEITIADVNGESMTDSALFKVRGHSTALSFVTKKAFTFKFSKKKDVLGMGAGKKWALLANTFDPTLLRNYIAFDLAQRMGLAYTSEQRFVELWVDGSCRGCYTLMEPVQEGKNRVDIDIESNDGMNDFLLELEASRAESDVTYFRTDGIRFAVSEPEEPNAEQLSYIKSTMDDIMAAVKTGDRDAVSAKIDIPSFTKFYLLNELYKTVDFNFSSVFFYYKDGVLYAGPAWDYDLAAGNSNAAYSATAAACAASDGLSAANCHLYQYLCSYDWFNDEVRKAFRVYYDDFSDIAAEGGMIDRLLEEYRPLFDRNYSDAGWNVSKWWVNVQKKPLSTYDENVGYLRDWLSARVSWLNEYYPPLDEPVAAYVRGDSNDDGTVTVLDVTLIQRRLAELTITTFNEKAADVDDDGLNIADATRIQRYLAGFDNIYHIDEGVFDDDPTKQQLARDPYESPFVPE